VVRDAYLLFHRRQLRPALRGEVAAQMPDGDYHLNLYVRLAGAEQLATEELGRTLIRTRQPGALDRHQNSPSARPSASAFDPSS
jgi:hypothetical protein